MALILTKVRNRILFRILPLVLKSIHLFILILFSALGVQLNAQTKVEIVGGGKMINDEIKKELYIVDNVIIKHAGVTIQCDSAIRKTELGIIEGFGHVYIYQPDTFTLSGGDYLKYDEKTKTALVTGKNVVLKDQSMTLLTTSLLYNTEIQQGYYTNWADILNENNTLKSKKGFYDRRGNVFHFKESVVLNSPDYSMYSDTLDYFANSKVAYFFGPTKIVSKENTIVCNYGWYNTKTEKAQFSKSATIYSDSGFITADSLLYDKKAGLGTGIGNIRLYDSSEHVDIYGQYGLHYQNTKISVISGQPMVIKADEKDTMYLLADTFYFKNDSIHKLLRAFHKTAILQNEFQGMCDSLIYDFQDSTIHMLNGPILWNDKNQISGDTIRIFIRNNSIQQMRVINSAFLASEVKPGYFNQISGRQMTNYFDSNKLKKVLVEGNAESIYYLRDNETDTAEYTGVNKVACGKMLIAFDSSKVKSIAFYAQPEGKIYPVNQFPESEKYLSGLDWLIELRPQKETFTERMKRRQRSVTEAIDKPKQKVKPPKKKGKI